MTRLVIVTSAIVLGSVAAIAQADLEPARFMDGSIPRSSPLVVAGGEVMLSVAVSSAGIVSAVDVLRSTPPFTDELVSAVRTWKFSPALDGARKPMDTHVLVGTVVGAPTLYGPTLGTPPKTISTADTTVPFPAQTSVPTYPINAASGGTVLVETRVDPAGRVVAATAVRSSPPFDSPALDAVRGWTFRPAQGPKTPPSTYAYLLFVFRQPLAGGTISGPGGGLTPPPKPTPLPTPTTKP